MKMTERSARALIGIVCSVLVLLCAASGSENGNAPPTVVFMTDFGLRDDSVAICKGVMYGIDPGLRIVDLTHEVTPFSISDGARYLYGATPYFPAGTVFVAVVDPGVGSSRKALVAKSKAGQFFVLPDNGLLTMVAERDGIEAAREIANPAWMIGAALSSTFHGRDIFSPAGAHLARGDDWNAVGPEIAPSELVRLAVPQVTISGHTLRGIVVATDGPFGNLVTNIAVADFAKLGVQRGQKLHLVVGVRELDAPLVKTFSDVAIGQPLVYIDSRGRVAVALNQGNFAETYQVKPPVAMSLTVPPGK